MTSKNGAVRQMAHKNTTRFAPTNEQRWDPNLMLFFGIPVSQSTFTNKVCDCTFMARINYKTVRHGQLRWVKWTEDLSYSRSLRSAVWEAIDCTVYFQTKSRRYYAEDQCTRHFINTSDMPPSRLSRRRTERPVRSETALLRKIKV